VEVLVKLSNKPLQRMNACSVRSDAGLCRDGAGYARTSSRPCYACARPSAFTAERQNVSQTENR
jgi:hypothetical protein